MYPRSGRLVRRRPVATETPAQQHETWMVDLLGRFPQRGGPRQDSLQDQLKDLWAIANRLGMYDAADFIDRTIKAVGPALGGPPACLGGDRCHGQNPSEHAPSCPLFVRT
jgi:hypothetical protein